MTIEQQARGAAITTVMKKRKTRSKQKNLKKDTRSADVKQSKFGTDEAGSTSFRQNRDRCYNCGQPGHWGKDCPEPDRRKSKKPNSAFSLAAAKSNGEANAQEAPVAPAEQCIFVAAGVAQGESDVRCEQATTANEEDGTVSAPPKKKKRRKMKQSCSESSVNKATDGSSVARSTEAEVSQSTATEPRVEEKSVGLVAGSPRNVLSEGASVSNMIMKSKRKRKSPQQFKIFVGQLGKDFADEESLRKHFEHFAPTACSQSLLTSVAVVPGKGVAFCAFATENARDCALAEVHKTSFPAAEDLHQADQPRRRLTLEKSPGGSAQEQTAAHSERVDALVCAAETSNSFLRKALDPQTREFLRTVSLHTVRKTLEECEAAAAKKNLKTHEEMSKFLMGMIKKRI
ncbi:unnamed protein product [Amoebophrya sp. A120]|nr:unnamed protein product [Amoebophrya sp. A120]|eukprot:GSA120T00017507001.1